MSRCGFETRHLFPYFKTVASLVCILYEVHSINKLQNSITLLVFQILRIQNIRFVGNLILSSSCDFFGD